MSILASAGRAKIYNTDGTGRDTYVSCNSGGFSMQNQPASAFKSGAMGTVQNKVNPAHYARGGGQGSPGKRIHYQTNGTGRDSYIACNQGGFASNYAFQNDRDAYVKSLRSYGANAGMGGIVQNSRKQASPRRDHFVEGQISIRSPKARNGLNMLRQSQQFQADRLAQPKRVASVQRVQIVEQHENDFLRSSQNFAPFNLGRSSSRANEAKNIGREDLQNQDGSAMRRKSMSSMMAKPRMELQKPKTGIDTNRLLAIHKPEEGTMGPTRNSVAHELKHRTQVPEYGI